MPVEKILLPVDITHPHPAYFQQLNELIPLKEVHAHLLYVKEMLPSFENLMGTMSDFPDDFQAQLDAKANSTFAEIKKSLEPLCKTVTTEIVAGPPAWMINEVARDEKTDVIVLMPGTHSRVQKFLLGSTSSKVVGHTPATTLLLRPVAKPDFKLTNVVIAVDGSDDGLNAAKEAVRMFDLGSRDVNVSLVNVVSVVGAVKYLSPVRFVAAIESNLLMSGEVILAESEKVLKDLGVKNVKVHLKEGDPASEIIKVAADEDAQLIVTGGQGRSAVEHFLVGSVSGWVASHAGCSTMMIKRPR